MWPAWDCTLELGPTPRFQYEVGAVEVARLWHQAQAGGLRGRTASIESDTASYIAAVAERC
jgi:hypothetical protein